MRAQRTPWYYYVVGFFIGLAAGAALAYYTRDWSVSVLGSSWIVPALLVALGIIVLILAWTVRKYAKGELKDIDPRRAFNTVVMAKSLAIAGSGLTGWYVGQLLVVIPRAEAPYYSRVILECAIAAAACLFDVIAGIIAEWWCQLPPNEGPEHPKVKQRKAMQRQRATQAESAKSPKVPQSSSKMPQ